MPVKRIRPEIQTTHPDLVQALKDELIAAREEGPADAPEIVEELLPRSDYFHVSVVWDRWAAIDPRERSQIIMQAYQQARGFDEMRKITLALGLTHAEAQRMQLQAQA